MTPLPQHTPQAMAQRSECFTHALHHLHPHLASALARCRFLNGADTAESHDSLRLQRQGEGQC